MRIKCTFLIVFYLICCYLPFKSYNTGIIFIVSVDKVSAYISTLLSKKTVHSAAFGLLVLLVITSIHDSWQEYFSTACPLYDLLLLRLDNTVQEFTDPETGMSQHMTSC